MKADAALLTALRTFAEHESMARLFMLEALGAGSEFQERLMELHDEFIAVIECISMRRWRRASWRRWTRRLRVERGLAR